MKERYEQEIEQLLGELDSEPVANDASRTSGQTPTPPDDQPSPFTPKPRSGIRLISPVKLALVGGILAVVGLLLPVLKWASMIGLAIMVVAVAWMVIRRMGSQSPSYWRGRPIEEAPQGTWQRFRRWLSR